MTIAPDTKDWTWVLDAPCPECRFVASEVAIGDVAPELRRNAAAWRVALGGPDAATRPSPAVWSPTEYACHVRDVHTVFGKRLGLMLGRDDPQFANWDQDDAAVERGYDRARPDEVAAELVAEAGAVADAYDAVPADALDRAGRRSNGSAFTVLTLARYHLHDVVHHLWDVRHQLTVAAYDAHARVYGEATRATDDHVGAALTAFAAEVGAGARVLEVGSGGGRDALALEGLGVSVRRTDVTAGFVATLREAGHEADVLDPLTDDLADPGRPGTPYDGVWANACLLHIARADLPTVLRRLAEATRPGGVLRCSVKEGDGERWSTHGTIEAPRMFTYWRLDDLVMVCGEAGWRVEETGAVDGLRDERWLEVMARREGAGE